MTTERFKQRFCDDASTVVMPTDGTPPFRLDGQPVTDADVAMIDAIVSQKQTKETKSENPSLPS